MGTHHERRLNDLRHMLYNFRRVNKKLEPMIIQHNLTYAEAMLEVERRREKGFRTYIMVTGALDHLVPATKCELCKERLTKALLQMAKRKLTKIPLFWGG